MSITLRPYQRDAANRLVALLKARRIAYLCGAVRTGKTLTAMEAVRQLGVQRVLVMTKKKAIKSIEADRDAYGLTDIVTVTNFEQLGKYKGTSWGLIIIDEAHGVGSYPKPSKRYKDIRAIHYSMVLLMSGTPSPESYSQLYHQFALGPAPWGQYRNFYQWAVDYVNVKQKYVGTGSKVNDYSGAIKDKVLKDIRHLAVVVTQEQAGFTTTIEEVVHKVKMNDRTYRLARRIMKDGVIGTPRGRSVVADTGAKAMSKLHQVYSGTVITERHGAVTWDTSKADYCDRTFTGKTAILYKFQAEGDMLRKVYAGRWTDSPEVFNSTGSETVYIGQVQSSREGVNLSSADDLVFFSIDHSALSYLQGRDRASYLGRDRANRVNWIFAENSIEPKIYEVVRKKEDYTQQHFRHDRGKLSSEADQAVRGAGMDGHQAGAGEQGGVSRPAVAEAERGGVRGGQRTIWATEQGAGVPDSGATVERV